MHIIGCMNDKGSAEQLLSVLCGIYDAEKCRVYTDTARLLSELDKPVEAAVIDTDIAADGGVVLAKTILLRYPLCNIIFVSDSKQYMPDAFDMYASGYILKPLTQEKLAEAVAHRRYRSPDLSGRRIRIRCFGSFEVFVDGRPISFKRQKSKELLAYLIDRRGALCNMDMLIGNIEPELPFDESSKSRIRVYVGDLMVTFYKNGIEGLIIKEKGSFAVDTTLVDCDYYRYLESDPYAISSYTGEYMMQFSFAEETRGFLEMKFYRDNRIDDK